MPSSMASLFGRATKRACSVSSNATKAKPGTKTTTRGYDSLTEAHYADKGARGPDSRRLPYATLIATAFGFGGVGLYVGRADRLASPSPPPTLLASVLAQPVPETSSTTSLEHSNPIDHNLSHANLAAARDEMAAIVGGDNIVDRLDELTRHTGSEWSSHPARPDEAPVFIVIPASTAEVSHLMKICHKRRIPVVGFSGGTSLEGNFSNTRRGICIDFGRMGDILEVHEGDLDVVVQPGVDYEGLNQKLAEMNLFFPPDPGPGAMIGGMVGTGCSGTNAFRYGTMKNWVVSLTIVLADGTVIKTRQRPNKSSAGYDLSRLFVGSEGTLGLVTEAVLRVTMLPQNQRVAVAAFPNIRGAVQCVEKIVQTGIQVAAVELLDEKAMQCINESGATEREWTETPTLFIKFSGTVSGVQEEIATVKQLAEGVGIASFIFAQDEQESEDLWGARKTMLWGGQALKKHDDDHTWITDCAVPMSRLPEMIETTKADIESCGLVGAIIGHVGDGNFHSAIFYAENERPVAEAVVHRMIERAIRMEGTVTGEHGVGLVKRDYLPNELGQDTVDAMRRIKEAFDPLCLLNCDKVIRMEQQQRPVVG